MNWWRRYANCDGEDPDIFFSTSLKKMSQAKALCDSCPVSQECLLYAVELEAESGEDSEGHEVLIAYGMYGGRTPDQRKALA